MLQTACAAGDVAASIADVRTVEEHLQSSDLQQFHQYIQQAGIVLLDANLSVQAIQVSSYVCLLFLYGVNDFSTGVYMSGFACLACR